MIFFFPLALTRLLLVLLISFCVSIAGWVWLQLFGFSRDLQQRVQQIWGKSILFVCGIHPVRNEVPATGHFILMPNHRSYIDVFIVAAFTPAAFVGKAELRRWPLLKLGARLTNSIFVSRSELKSLLNTMHQIKNSVNKNIPVALFPEGTTCKGPLTKPFKNGSFKIAADTRIPVIPIAIHYPDSNDAWVGKDTFLGHFFRQLSKPAIRVKLLYGPPLTNPDYKTLQQETRETIDSMLKSLQEKITP